MRWKDPKVIYVDIDHQHIAQSPRELVDDLIRKSQAIEVELDKLGSYDDDISTQVTIRRDLDELQVHIWLTFISLTSPMNHANSPQIEHRFLQQLKHLIDALSH
eukprot:TRINITY_DN16493_c0_g1::TRINITY_DN16493_c0_g1_i1::g.1791::m.1791 TRINITY_DN16493_c0_g1::TRINITY_DN16493_c0_g1_i1::g.1791  ORF type:complete len:104 (+),score=12.87,HTH_DeoR/PF08220.7/0.058,Med21/PF11221.3/0.14,Med21/PF11221.3/2.3e+03 TRINITY_DN16493_c0_g1_i1:77-388(+)